MYEKAADHGSRHAAEVGRCQEQAVAEIRRIRCHAGQQVLIDVRIDATEDAPGHNQCHKKRQQLPTARKEQAVERDGTQREKAYGRAGTPGEEIAPQIASAHVQETIDEKQRCDELSRQCRNLLQIISEVVVDAAGGHLVGSYLRRLHEPVVDAQRGNAFCAP